MLYVEISNSIIILPCHRQCWVVIKNCTKPVPGTKATIRFHNYDSQKKKTTWFFLKTIVLDVFEKNQIIVHRTDMLLLVIA